MKKGKYQRCNDYSIWRFNMLDQLLYADSFEIHCWKEETEAIHLALTYGRRKESDWEAGEIICGQVTPEFIQWLIEIPRPKPGLQIKLTPFFSIFLDNGFSSEHYGTELIKR